MRRNICGVSYDVQHVRCNIYIYIYDTIYVVQPTPRMSSSDAAFSFGRPAAPAATTDFAREVRSESLLGPPLLLARRICAACTRALTVAGGCPPARA